MMSFSFFFIRLSVALALFTTFPLEKKKETLFSCLFQQAAIDSFFLMQAFFDLLDRPLQSRIFTLSPSSPYEEGRQIGLYFKDEVRSFCIDALPLFKNRLLKLGIDPERKAKKTEKKVDKKLREEMQGIADGAGVGYLEILELNTLPLLIDQWGCSMIGLIEGEKPLIATNHFPSSSPGSAGSFDRYQQLHRLFIQPTISSLKTALAAVSLPETVQSMIFDVQNRSIHLAVSNRCARAHRYHCVSLQDFFPKEKPSSKKVFLARTLDWPMHFLGPKTILLIRKTKNHSTAIITWPGYLGALSGMNEEGLCLAVSAVQGKRQTALPSSFFLRELLEKTKRIDQALLFLKKQNPSCCMNLFIAAEDGFAHAELDPARCSKGPAFLMQVKN